MGKILGFKSCAVGGEFTGFGQVTPSSYSFIGIAAPANINTQIQNSYLSDPDLAGKVTGLGYGWQKFVIPSNGKVKFTVRGAAGGSTGSSGYSINPTTGAVNGNGNKPGRGAKICGSAKLKKGDILYILVGMRGWCNNGADWGGGGGGASVVLLDNPAGAYTFSPNNRKVDILFVAGGGGGTYDSSFGNNYYGKDAVLTNGTSTGGGSSNKARGGAGMTGNGAGGSGGNPAYSILSGTPSYTSLNSVHYGGWGGGGGSYNGGGGGGGYSGGSASDGTGGNGGTSYINPLLCEEISRGYATVAEDSQRNLTNPWSAYGFVELELGRAEGKFILVKDSDGYKWFNGSEDIYGNSIPGASNEWELLTDQTKPTDATYVRYGNCIITNTVGLKDQARFLISSTEPQESISIDGLIAHEIVELIKDVSLADISTYKSITATTNLTGVSMKFAVSKDYGATWQTYNSGQWVDINIKNKNEFSQDGYDMAFFSAIPLADLASYNAKSLRIALLIQQNSYTGSNALISSINSTVDLVGSWARFKEAQASYQYITDDTVEITFKEAGNYKVNYLDSII